MHNYSLCPFSPINTVCHAKPFYMAKPQPNRCAWECPFEGLIQFVTSIPYIVYLITYTHGVPRMQARPSSVLR